MKPFAIIILMAFVACNRESSPEGRLSLRAERLERGIDSLSAQNRAIMDSLSTIRSELKILKQNHLQSKN